MLGRGAFATVALVQLKKGGATFAMKSLNKRMLVAAYQARKSPPPPPLRPAPPGARCGAPQATACRGLPGAGCARRAGRPQGDARPPLYRQPPCLLLLGSAPAPASRLPARGRFAGAGEREARPQPGNLQRRRPHLSSRCSPLPDLCSCPSPACRRCCCGAARSRSPTRGCTPPKSPLASAGYTTSAARSTATSSRRTCCSTAAVRIHQPTRIHQPPRVVGEVVREPRASCAPSPHPYTAVAARGPILTSLSRPHRPRGASRLWPRQGRHRHLHQLRPRLHHHLDRLPLPQLPPPPPPPPPSPPPPGHSARPRPRSSRRTAAPSSAPRRTSLPR